MKESRERVTRADVARMAQVSETIVSYVINNNRYVAKDKRQRVEEAIRRLNYRPNNIARALKGKRSNQILFIADNITNEYFSNLVSEMDKYAYKSGYLISLCANRNTPEFVAQVISRQYDGIILSSATFPEEYVDKFTQAGIPVVMFRRLLHQTSSDNVAVLGTGLYRGARMAVRHLIEKGCRNVVYVDRVSQKGHFSTADDLRFAGFMDEMKAGGFFVDAGSAIQGCRNQEELIAAVKRRLRRGDKVDGFFGRDDTIARMTMGAVMEEGLLVPQDVRVIGFNDSSISRFCSPKLSTVRMNQPEIAAAALDMLNEMIGGGKPEDRDFDTELIERESTASEG